MKKLNNKGFSLVELIIVIAIMAILVGVMAPSLMKYIEKSRYSADTQIADSAYSALKYAMADEASYKDVATLTQSGDVTVDFSTILGAGSGYENVGAEVAETFGDTAYAFDSKAFKGQQMMVTLKQSGEFTVTITSTDPSKWDSLTLPKSDATGAASGS